MQNIRSFMLAVISLVFDLALPHLFCTSPSFITWVRVFYNQVVKNANCVAWIKLRKTIKPAKFLTSESRGIFMLQAGYGPSLSFHSSVPSFGIIVMGTAYYWDLEICRYDDGYQQIVNVDFSKPVIVSMMKKNLRIRPKMKWQVGDMTSMKVRQLDLFTKEFRMILLLCSIALECGGLVTICLKELYTHTWKWICYLLIFSGI